VTRLAITPSQSKLPLSADEGLRLAFLERLAGNKSSTVALEFSAVSPAWALAREPSRSARQMQRATAARESRILNSDRVSTLVVWCRALVGGGFSRRREPDRFWSCRLCLGWGSKRARKPKQRTEDL